MKKTFYKVITTVFWALVITTNNSFAQTTIQISASNMQNAYVSSLYPTSNFDGYPEFDAIAWTNGSPFSSRSYISFDLSAIPTGATIDSATLSLFGDSATSNYQSDAGSNASYLQLITSSWSASSIMWNNQPTTTTTDEVLIPQSTLKYQNYPNINVTQLISDLFTSSSYYGLRMILEDETQYNSMVFASNTNSETSIRPVLSVTYTYNGGNYHCSSIKGTDDVSGAFITNLYPGTNFDSYPEFDAIAWTNGSAFISRGLINFDLSQIPLNATINSAALSLYGDSATSNYQGDAGNNATYLKRVTSTWTSNAVTWNNQPTTTDTDEVLIPQSTTMYENYPDIDITQLITDVFKASNNYGMMLHLENEQIYTSTVFASTENIESSLWPVLQVCYTIPSGIQPVNSNTFKWNIYPDPFESNFAVSYNLTQSANVSFELYNIIGQEVAETTIGEEDAGSYHYTFNVDQNLPLGVYIVKALVNSIVIAGKIIKD